MSPDVQARAHVPARARPPACHGPRPPGDAWTRRGFRLVTSGGISCAFPLPAFSYKTPHFVSLCTDSFSFATAQLSSFTLDRRLGRTEVGGRLHLLRLSHAGASTSPAWAPSGHGRALQRPDPSGLGFDLRFSPIPRVGELLSALSLSQWRRRRCFRTYYYFLTGTFVQPHGVSCVATAQ